MFAPTGEASGEVQEHHGNVWVQAREVASGGSLLPSCNQQCAIGLDFRRLARAAAGGSFGASSAAAAGGSSRSHACSATDACSSIAVTGRIGAAYRRAIARALRAAVTATFRFAFRLALDGTSGVRDAEWATQPLPASADHGTSAARHNARDTGAAP